MIRRNRGRPEGPTPLFVGDCVRLDATTLLAKSRGCFVSSEPSPWWTVSGLGALGSETRSFPIQVTWSCQRLGAQRRWWRCPRCARRCGVLLLHEASDRLGCRRCLQAHYLSDYPGRYRRRLAMQAIGDVLSDADAGERPALWAPRRRGVRRGRRVHVRAVRQFLKGRRVSEVTLAALSTWRARLTP